ncbi:hypothetical protein [Photorhabdus aegyptia]|uniref:PAAR domain-containing protein n=1 Tax=Photorhabdus aegyptia TaxID=2805098 RepID=A0A022PCW1_9GAMM|nr:hypothetical protein [Photorhabdus aegyptia]EYU13364.1 hypothetical protein BA1DRAFT_04158 [Photorhabdus aegyptia]
MNGMFHVGNKIICGDQVILNTLIMKLNGTAVARKESAPIASHGYRHTCGCGLLSFILDVTTS